MEREKETHVDGLSDVTISVPVEVLDLLRFMCATWDDIDTWAHKSSSENSIGDYPQIQGTSNQINLKRIGEQEHSTDNLHKAVEWMRSQQQ